jgi:hypothetical protein
MCSEAASGAVTNKRKGQITMSGEWAKHLRPILKRAFWKSERQAERVVQEQESNEYLIAGRSFRRRETIELTPQELEDLRTRTATQVLRPVEWPLPDSIPHFQDAYLDPGGTPVWGPGPYLKVPNTNLDGERLTNRVFCPWGYTGNELRIDSTGSFATISDLSLAKAANSEWIWAIGITLKNP